MDKTPQRLAAAFIRFMDAFPYFTTAALALFRIESEKVPTIAVDQWWRLYFNPTFVEKTSVEELVITLYHEMNHLIREHADRLEAYAHEIVMTSNGPVSLANLGGDLAINDDLKTFGMDRPDWMIYPGTFDLPDGKFEEWYCEHLRKQIPQVSVCNGQCSGEGAQEGGGLHQPGCDGGKDGKNGKRQHPSCGSCSDGQQKPWEEPKPGESDQHGLSDAEQKLKRKEVAHEIKEHSRTRENMPAGLKRWADEQLSSNIPWQQKLASAIRRSVAETMGMVNYTWRRPSRRQSIFPDIAMPSLRRPIPKLAVVIDTSGSMSDRMLAQAIAEVGAILRATGASTGVPVLSTDAAVHTARSVFSPRQVRLAGGGGTDMRVGITAALALKPKPEVVIVISDGETPWPDRPIQGARLIIALTDEHSKKSTPAWATTVVCQTEEGRAA